MKAEVVDGKFAWGGGVENGGGRGFPQDLLWYSNIFHILTLCIPVQTAVPSVIFASVWHMPVCYV